MSKNFKVKWVVVDKRIIKFCENDDAYQIAEDVSLDGIKTDISVEATIKDNVIVAIKAIESKKEEKKKEEPKQEEAKPKDTEPEDVPETCEQTDNTIVTWTLQAKTSNANVVKFAEQPNPKDWYPIPEDLQETFAKMEKGTKVTVAINKVDAEYKGKTFKKDGVVALIKAEEIVKEEPEKEKTESTQEETKQVKRSGSYRDEDSTDKRTASMNAKDVVVALINTGKVTKEENLEEYIKKYTKLFYTTTKEL